MNKEHIQALAVKAGFRLKPQTSGEMDLDTYVYDFAQALIDGEQAPAIVPCGGCGQKDPHQRCAGCHHVFQPIER